jgi:O-antigen ligase
MMFGGTHRAALPSPVFGMAALTVAAAALAGALAAIALPFALVVVALVLVAAYLGRTARRPLGESLLVGMVALSGVVDIFQKVNAGAGSGQAIETVAFVLLAFLVCMTGVAVPDGAAGRALGLVALFVTFAIVSVTWGSVTTQTYQNVFVYVVCVLFMAIAATVARYRGAAVHEILSKAFLVAAAAGLGLYAVSVAIAGPGTGKIIAARPFGLMCVVLVAWFMGGGLIGRRWAYWIVGLAVLLTLLSLGRSALAAELVLIALARLDLRNFRGWLIGIGAAAVTLAVALSAVFFYAPLHHRFFHGDKATVAGVTINVTGRDALWSANWGWFKQKPLIGWGAGASDRLTDSLPFHGAGHPHNDYLRILVDYGIVGFVLWMTAYLSLLRLTWRRWQEVRGTRLFEEQIHAAAFLVLVGIGLTMIVDNPLIELARMGPMGILVGLSLGLPLVVRRPQTSRPPTQVPAVAR